MGPHESEQTHHAITWDPGQGSDWHYSTPPDANMTDAHGHPVHVDPSGAVSWDPVSGGQSANITWDHNQGDDGNHSTPPDANMTDPHGHAVHGDSSNSINWDHVHDGHSSNIW